MGPVGFVGLGQIGTPIAKRLLGWEGGFVVHDLWAPATELFADAGAIVADGVPAVGAACDLVSVMVRDDAQVATVVGELLTTLRPGSIIAVHSTIRAETAERQAAVAAEHDVALLDVPVSGGVIGATNGTLAAMVGGDRAAYDRAKPVFERWATAVVHMGPVGSGTRAKLARNLIHNVAFTGVGEALRLAEAAGLDLQKLGRVVRHSDSVMGGPGAVILRDTAAPLTPDDGLYDILRHARDLGEKDLGLALELGRELGVDLPLAELAHRHLAEALGVPHDPGTRV